MMMESISGLVGTKKVYGEGEPPICKCRALEWRTLDCDNKAQVIPSSLSSFDGVTGSALTDSISLS